MSTLPARTGWDWLKQGVGLFRQQPAALMALFFISVMIAIGITAVPLIGSMVVVILLPSFSMAFMRACLMIENGTRITPVVLLTGFRKPVLARLCKVGLIYLIVLLFSSLLAFLVMPAPFRQVPMNMNVTPGGELPFSGADALIVLAMFALEVVLLLTLCFAAPLTYWKHMHTGKAIFYSFFTVIRAGRVFTVLMLSWFGMFMLFMLVVGQLVSQVASATVIIMWLMFFFMLFLQCALYAGYRDIFGKPDEGAQPA